MDEMERLRPAEELPADVVDLAELLAEKVELVRGDTRLELIYAEGTLRFAFLHAGPVDRHELRRRFSV